MKNFRLKANWTHPYFTDIYYSEVCSYCWTSLRRYISYAFILRIHIQRAFALKIFDWECFFKADLLFLVHFRAQQQHLATAPLYVSLIASTLIARSTWLSPVVVKPHGWCVTSLEPMLQHLIMYDCFFLQMRTLSIQGEL